jgi:phosphoribosyl-ATP pyrophosphohydrolase
MTEMDKAMLVSLLEIYQVEKKEKANGDPALKVTEECAEVIIADLLGSTSLNLEKTDLLMSLILEQLPLDLWQKKMEARGRELFDRQKSVLNL